MTCSPSPGANRVAAAITSLASIAAFKGTVACLVFSSISTQLDNFTFLLAVASSSSDISPRRLKARKSFGGGIWESQSTGSLGVEERKGVGVGLFHLHRRPIVFLVGCLFLQLDSFEIGWFYGGMDSVHFYPVLVAVVEAYLVHG